MHPNYIAQAWPVIKPLLDKTKKWGELEISVDQIKAFLVKGLYGLMTFNEAGQVIGAVVFEWINYPNDRVFFVTAIGGRTTKPCVDEMFAFAKQNGATCVRGVASESVARLWRKYEFKEIQRVVERRL